MFTEKLTIGNKFYSNRLIIIICIAVLSVAFSLYRIYSAEKELSAVVEQLSRENEKYLGISEEIFHLDEKLTIATFLYIYTQNNEWKNKYKAYRKKLTSLLSHELRITSDAYILKSIQALKSSEIKMVALENEAIRFMHRNQTEAALEILNGDNYQFHKKEYTDIVAGIRNYLIEAADKNKDLIASNLRQNSWLYLLILFLNLSTWLLLIVLFKNSKQASERSNIMLQRFMNVFENNQTGVLVTNQKHIFTLLNNQFIEMVGYAKDELDNMSIFDLVSIEQRESLIEKYEQIEKGEIDHFICQKKLNCKNGEHIHVMIKTFGHYDNHHVFVEAISSILDITQQIETNKEIMKSIIETENLERTRIATTLHDSIGQNLTSLHLMLGSIAKSDSIKNGQLKNVEKAIEITKDTIVETREISHNLMPKYISRFGLIASVENLVQDLNATHSSTEFLLFTNFKDNILNVDTQVAIYRIIQEAINNILKYSNAKNAYIQLVKHNNIVTVLIDDDGCGFELESINLENSLGLKSIKNRANSISADLEIDTQPNRGTTISLQITLNK